MCYNKNLSIIYLNLLNITLNYVKDILIQNSNQFLTAKKDEQGKRKDKTPNKGPNNDQKPINLFIKLLPTAPYHYCYLK